MKLYRPAKQASFSYNYTKTLLQTACFWFIFLLVIPSFVLWAQAKMSLPLGFSPVRAIAIPLFAYGSIVGLSAAYIMTLHGEGTPLPPDCPNHLVIRGPYAFVRNPMAVGGICQGVAVGIGIGSWGVVLYALAGIPVWMIVARPSEERDMTERFGEAFTQYKSNVRLWIPRLTPYQVKS